MERSRGVTAKCIVSNEISHEVSPLVKMQPAMSQQKKQLVIAFPWANGLQPQLLRYVEKEARERPSHDQATRILLSGERRQ